jgi:DNA-binding HxlR family transcriptional regulator
MALENVALPKICMYESNLQVDTIYACTIILDTMKPKTVIKTEISDADARLVEQTMDMLGGKWKVLILWHLGMAGVCRFGELRRKLPEITQRTLTLQLRELEADGLVHRTVYAEVPPHTDYRQTPPAQDLTDVYMALKRWSLAHRSLLTARAAKSSR